MDEGQSQMQSEGMCLGEGKGKRSHRVNVRFMVRDKISVRLKIRVKYRIGLL